jgi:hypothetical protein
VSGERRPVTGTDVTSNAATTEITHRLHDIEQLQDFQRARLAFSREFEFATPWFSGMRPMPEKKTWGNWKENFFWSTLAARLVIEVG